MGGSISSATADGEEHLLYLADGSASMAAAVQPGSHLGGAVVKRVGRVTCQGGGP